MKTYIVRYWWAPYGIPKVGARFQAIWGPKHRWGKWTIEILEDMPPDDTMHLHPHKAKVAFISPDAPALEVGQFFPFWSGPHFIGDLEVLSVE